MFRSLWFHKLLGLKSRSVRRRQAAQTRHFVRLHIEGLEERITPTGGVTNITAANASALAAAIDTANQDTGIGASHDVFNITLTGTNPYNLGQQLDITTKAQVNIIGTSPTGSVINAANESRAFALGLNTNVAFENLTIQGGNVTVDNSLDPHGLANKGGGAVEDLGGNLSLSNVVIQNNVVHGAFSFFDGDADGGGVYVSGAGSLTIKSGSVITNNQALGFNASKLVGVSGGNAHGGGVYVSGGTFVSIDSSTLSDNLAQGGNGGAGHQFKTRNGGVASFPAGQGGAATGGGMFLTGISFNVSVTKSTVTGNNVFGGVGGVGATGLSVNGGGTDGGDGGHGGTAQGGGLKLIGGGLFTLSGTNVSSNTATGGLGGKGGVGGSGGGNGGNGGAGGEASGGGVAVTANAILDTAVTTTIVNNSIIGNTAKGGNGGLGGTGGADTISGDGGEGGDGGNALGGSVNAGGIGASNLTMVNNTINEDTAQGGSGGAGGLGGQVNGTLGVQAPVGEYGVGLGGGVGVFNFFSTPPALVNNTIAFNVAAQGTGNQPPLFDGVTQAAGGGIFAFNIPPFSPLAPLMVNNMLEMNQALVGPDYRGFVNPNNSNNFVSNAAGAFGGPFGLGWVNNDLNPFNNNIINNGALQLGPLTVDPTTGLSFYPLASKNVVVDKGTNSVLQTIATAEGVPFDASDLSNITDEIGNPRVVNDVIDIGAIESNATPPTVAVGTTLSLGSQTVPFKSSSQTANIAVLVNSVNGPVNQGTVTVTLIGPNGPVTGSVDLSTGNNTVSLTLPAGLPAGVYQLTGAYAGVSGLFLPSSALGSLTVQSSGSGTGSVTATGPVTVTGGVTAGNVSAGPVTSQGPTTIVQSAPDVFTALFTIAVDAAELVLATHGIMSIGGVPLPSTNQLVAEIQANFPFADGLATAALQAGVTAGNQAIGS